MAGRRPPGLLVFFRTFVKTQDMSKEISEATMIPEIFAIRYPETRGFRVWCHGKKLGELELLLPIWEEKELYEHCGVMLQVIEAKRLAKTRTFHETTLKPEGN